MKKFFFLIITFTLLNHSLPGQNGPLKPSLLVQQAKTSLIPSNVQIFNISDGRDKPELPTDLKTFSLLNLDKNALKNLIRSKESFISLTIPQVERNDLVLELVEVFPFAEDIVLKTAPSMEVIRANMGRHFRGIIKGQDKSIAAISVFDDRVMGFIAHPRSTGNLVIGKLENSDQHIMYQDDQIAHLFHPECMAKDNEFHYTPDQLKDNQSGQRALTDCVRLYLEVDYDIYQNKGSSIPNVTSFVTGIFNQVSTLYANEQLNAVISEIVIWTQPSPYNGTTSIDMLNAFTAYRQGFNGNLAQLLSYKASGGVAYVDGICRSNPDYSMSYAGINNTYQNVPTYSWTVEVCTHEFGHLFGSQHTHACVWNGNNTAIDGCYTTEGGCPNPGIPTSGGGTIMSYCHLTNAGINFSNGFGLQPGNIIRSKVASANCLQSCSGGGGGGGDNQCTSNVLSLEIRTDNYPTETTWDIRNSSGTILYAGGPYNVPNTLNTIPLCLPTACYTFNIYDAYGDGICCSYGNGYYNVKQGASMLITGGAFAASESRSFCATGNTASLTLSAASGSATSAAGSASVGVTSNIAWTASSNATAWCTVAPASGSNNGTLTLAYTANTNTSARSATITVTGGGITQSYTLTQAGNSASLTLSAATGSVTSAAGSASVGVTSNVAWTASSNATAWCTVTPASGSNNGSLTLAYTDNTTTSARSATITVSGGGITQTYTLTQAGNSASLTLSAASGSATLAAGSASVGVTSNIAWTASSNATAWCTVTPASGSNNGTLTLAYTANTNTSVRLATITVTGGGITQTYTLTQAGNTASLTLSAATGSVTSAAGSASVGVTSNVAWTASSNATAWCTVTPASGSNNGTLNVAYTANTNTSARSATITVSGGGITQTYILTQAGNSASLTLSAATGSVTSAAGSASVGVTSNVAWTASSNATAWCTVTPASGSNNGTLNVAYTANTNTSARSATITVSGGGITQTYTLTQAGNSASLTLSAATGSATSAAGSASVGVTSNVSWTASSNATAWCTVTPASGINNGTLTLAYTANTTTSARSATITVTGGGITRTYVLTQSGVAASLTLSASTASVTSAAGSASVGVTSNVSWTASSNATAWCTVTPASGSNNGTLTLAYTANTTTSARSATITVSGGGITRTYVLTQSGVAASLTLSASTASVTSAAGSASVGVTSNVSWTASSNATAWCTVTPASGSNNGTLTIAYTANTTTSARSATITVTGGGITRTYVLTQSSVAAFLTLSASTASVTSAAGSASVGVTSNVAWTASSNATAWCTVTPASGSNNGTLNVAYTANTTTSARSATITVTGGGITRTYVLTQSGNTGGNSSILSGHYFETGWDDWIDGGNDCFRYGGNMSPEGNYSIRLRDNSGEQSSMTSPTYNLTPYNSVMVEFKFRGLSMEPGDDFWLLHYNGSRWNNIATFVSGTHFNNNQLYTITVTLNGPLSNVSKFRFQCHGNENNDEVYIDAIVIRGTTASGIIENPIVIIPEDNIMYKENDISIIQIYPNPATDMVYIKSEEVITRISIFNSSGQLILKLKSDEIQNVDISELNPGFFIMRIETDENVYTKTLIKH